MSKTPDKDKMKCHYSQEIGHFIRDCRKRLRDEEKSAKYNLFTMSEEQEQKLSNDELKEKCILFATVKHLMELRNSTTLVPKRFKKPQYTHKHDKVCLSPEAAQHVYQAVQNNQPVTHMHIKTKCDIDLHSCESKDSVETGQLFMKLH